jgi:hypothetical protein
LELRRKGFGQRLTSREIGFRLLGHVRTVLTIDADPNHFRRRWWRLGPRRRRRRRRRR